VASISWSQAKSWAEIVVNAKRAYAQAQAKGNEDAMEWHHGVAVSVRESLINAGYDWVEELVGEDRTLAEAELGLSQLKEFKGGPPESGTITVDTGTTNKITEIPQVTYEGNVFDTAKTIVQAVDWGWVGIGVVGLLVIGLIRSVFK